MDVQRVLISVVWLALLGAPAHPAQSRGDLIVENVYEVSPGMPLVRFIIRRDPAGMPLGSDPYSIFRTAVVDTGASAISLSEDTAAALGLQIDPNARFTDAGVGGEESSRVSEPLIVGVAPYAMDDIEDVRSYKSSKPARCKVKQRRTRVQDVIGMPAIKDQVLILDPGAGQGSSNLAAELCRADDPNIPPCPWTIQLRTRSFNVAPDKRDIPPLPTLVQSPVIDPVVVEYKGKMSSATWLLDTGGRISLISTAQAQRLGLLDADGKQQVQPVSTLSVMGTGRMASIPVYSVDRLILTDVTGRKVIYTHVPIGVHDIKYKDAQTGGTRALDGVFGCNLLCPGWRQPGSPARGDAGPAFDKVVIDLSKLQLGLRPSQ